MSSVASPRAKEQVKSAPVRNIERRSHSESFPSIILPFDSNARKVLYPTQDGRSKYCAAELSKLEFSRRPGRYESAPAKRQGTRESAEEARMKDVMFLRKMLAINKKQEMMLNKKLAKLLEEEEFQSFGEGGEKYKNIFDQPNFTPLPLIGVKAEKEDEDVGGTDSIYSHRSPSREAVEAEEKATTRKIQHDTATKISAARKVEYDINGRRIYFYSDIEKYCAEEESEQKQELKDALHSKRMENSSKTNKKGSACSKKTFTMKKSLTYINTQSRVLKKPPAKSKRKVREEDGSKSCANSKNPLNFELKPKAGCQGDGAQVQNVVVQCSTVFRNSSTSKKNRKVWDYESLHSLKPENSSEKNRPVASEQTLHDVADCDKNSRNRPISVRKSNIQIQFKSPSRRDERGSTVETVFMVRKKFSDVKS